MELKGLRRPGKSKRVATTLIVLITIASVLLWKRQRQLQLNSALFAAVHKYSVGDAERCIRLGADVNAVDYTVYTKGSSLRGFTNRLIRPREFDKFGPTPLMEVIWRVDLGDDQARELTLNTRRHTDLVKLLLDHGADPNVSFAGTYSYIAGATRALKSVPLLAKAIGTADQQTIDLLIEHGADVNVPDLQTVEAYNTPFSTALSHMQVHTFKMLLDHGLDIHRPSSNGSTPIEEANFLRKFFPTNQTWQIRQKR